MDELGPPANVRFEVSRDEAGAPVVTLAGELDMSDVHEVQAAVEPILAHRPQRLTVDVAEVRFADSSAIALWVNWAARVGEFELRHPPALLRQVIESMGLSRTLRIEP